MKGGVVMGPVEGMEQWGGRELSCWICGLTVAVKGTGMIEWRVEGEGGGDLGGGEVNVSGMRGIVTGEMDLSIADQWVQSVTYDGGW